MKASRASGIRKSNIVIMKTYILDGVFTAVAAVVFMARMNSGIPALWGVGEFDVITAVVLGGTSLTGGTGNRDRYGHRCNDRRDDQQHAESVGNQL